MIKQIKSSVSSLQKMDKKGFSLVELIVVLGIVAALAASSAPLLIRYVDKARKAMDVQTASVIFRAAELGYTSGNDEAYLGYSVCYDSYNENSNSFNGYPACMTATADGFFYSNYYPSSTDKLNGRYALRPIAWCRGVQYSGDHSTWENVLMKSVIDNSGKNGVNIGKAQRKYTDEMLWALTHEAAAGESDHGGVRKYDGYSSEFLRFKYIRPMLPKNSNVGKNPIRPECWIVYRRDDNGMPEVWIGNKAGSIRGTRRLYPDPNPEYR